MTFSLSLCVILGTNEYIAFSYILGLFMSIASSFQNLHKRFTFRITGASSIDQRENGSLSWYFLILNYRLLTECWGNNSDNTKFTLFNDNYKKKYIMRHFFNSLRTTLNKFNKIFVLKNCIIIINSFSLLTDLNTYIL